MSESIMTGDREPTNQISIDQIKSLVATLNEEDKITLAAELPRDVLGDEANKGAAVEAVKAASGEAKQDVVAEVVRVASLDAKKAAVVEAVESAHDGEKQEVITEAVNAAPLEAKMAAATEAVESAVGEGKERVVTEVISAAPLEAKKAAVIEAVHSAADGEKREILAKAVSVAPPDAKKAAVAEAVETASDANKQDIAATAMRSLSTEDARTVARNFLPISQDTANEIWKTVVGSFKWVLWGSTIALVGAIGVALFKEVDAAYVQILLTVFTTVAGIFAGFIGGKALSDTTGGSNTSA